MEATRSKREGVPRQFGESAGVRKSWERGKVSGKRLTKPALDVALGRAIVSPVVQAKKIVGLRISPVVVVEERRGFR